MLRVIFLGTASSRPTVGRNVSALAVQREGQLFLFDCGEGTQRQMMRFGVGFSVTDIFLTHFHADHYLGVTGLLRTFSLQGRAEPLAIWAPPDERGIVDTLVRLGGEGLPFSVDTRELSAGEAVNFGDFQIRAFPTRHTATSIGLALIERDRPGRFDVEAARAAGVPEGPLFGQLHRGEVITLDDGRVVQPGELVGPARPGRRLVYSSDTRPCSATVEAAAAADLLIHEATFTSEEAARAADTGHSTAREAAGVARDARVRRLVLTHVSARYSERSRPLLAEARAVYPEAQLARDGTSVEVPYPPGDPGTTDDAGTADDAGTDP